MATKKKAAKTAKKKGAKPKVTKPKATKPAGKTVPFQIEDPTDMPLLRFKTKFDPEKTEAVQTQMAQNVRKSIEILTKRSSVRSVRLYTPAQLRRMLFEFDEIYMQHMLGSVGVRVPSAFEVIAPEHVGKTTFVFDWIGRLAEMGCYSVYIECEGKQMNMQHVKRILDRDPKKGALKLNTIEFAAARQLVQCDDVLKKAVKDLRKRCDSDPETKGNPIFAFVDPWSGLMSSVEAVGNTSWGLSEKSDKKPAKDAGTASNFGHSKHAAIMKRWLPSFMEEYNVSVVLINHQNEKIDMQKGPATFAKPSESKNDTRTGGKAMKQLCPYRLTILKTGDIREKSGAKKVYGFNTRVMLIKNSYGPRDRTCEFSVFFDNYDDRPGYLAPAITYDLTTPAWMVKMKLLGMTSTDGLYTCDALGCVAVPPEEIMTAFRARPDLVSFVGSQLGIEGYEAPPASTPAVTPEQDSEEPPIVE